MMNGEMAPEANWWEDDEHQGRNLPRYTDHVLPLRILVECLAKLGRLDDVERTLNESLSQEIRKLAQKEQAKTFARLDKVNPSRRRRRDLKDFRRHLTGLLSAFGCVMIRLSHLTQILRHRIVSETLLCSHKFPLSMLTPFRRQYRQMRKTCIPIRTSLRRCDRF